MSVLREEMSVPGFVSNEGSADDLGQGFASDPGDAQAPVPEVVVHGHGVLGSHALDRGHLQTVAAAYALPQPESCRCHTPSVPCCLGSAYALCLSQEGVVVPDLSPAAAATVNKLVAINAQIKDLTEEAEALKAQLRKALDVGEYTVNGKPALSVSETRKFDVTVAALVIPPGMLPGVQINTISRTMAQEMLPPELYAKCQSVSPKHTIRILGDA
ncbi:MAG: hypothetical protein JWO11_3581 [Nocardioides sp.]|nr:hypothetical protein [Nocardioides sp.]